MGNTAEQKIEIKIAVALALRSEIDTRVSTAKLQNCC